MINDYFKFNIQSGILPGKAMIEEARKRYKILENRKWLVRLYELKSIISSKPRSNIKNTCYLFHLLL